MSTQETWRATLNKTRTTLQCGEKNWHGTYIKAAALKNLQPYTVGLTLMLTCIVQLILYANR